MRLRELFESASITPRNVDSNYIVSNVKIDNTRGMGSTPQGQNVVYQGFVAEIKISNFLKLATYADREEDAKKFADMIKEGKAIASPFLEVSFTDPDDLNEEAELNFTIKNHEGRARARAIQMIAGDIYFPIQFILRGGVRARHLNEIFFKLLREEYWKTQEGTLINVPVKDIFWNGQTI